MVKITFLQASTLFTNFNYMLILHRFEKYCWRNRLISFSWHYNPTHTISLQKNVEYIIIIVFHQQMSPHKLEIIFQAKEVEEENGYNEYEDDFEVRRQFLTFPFESMDIIYLLCISYLCVNQCIYLKKASIYYKINKTYNFCILISIILTDAVKVWFMHSQHFF